MNFREATNELLESVTLQDLADALGAPLQTIRQARAMEGTTAFRSPPQSWERAVMELARKRAKDYMRLADRLAAKAS